MKKKMLVPLKPQQKRTPPSTNMRKVVSLTGKTAAKTLGSRMKKTPRKKLHRGTKANYRRQICRILTTTMTMMTRPVPKTTPATSMAMDPTLATALAPETAEVTEPAPEEALWNGCGS